MPRRKRDLTARQQLARGPMDLPFLMLVLMLTAIGVIAMFSASYASAYYESKDHNATYYFVRQALFAVGGIVVMWLVSRIDYQTFRWVSVFILMASVVLLVLVKVPGIGVTRNGANRWIKLPGLPQFQPSEIAKVGVILYFAARMSKRDTVKKKPWNSKTWLGRMLSAMEKIGLLELLPYLGILVVVGGLLLLEPHMSGTILIFAGAAAVLFAGGIHWGWFAAGGAVMGGGLWFIMNNTDYMLRRLTLWKDPWSDPQGGGFQTIQSLYAIGSGGLLGKGFGKSMQKFLYLPEEQNDFVFAVWFGQRTRMRRMGGQPLRVAPVTSPLNTCPACGSMSAHGTAPPVWASASGSGGMRRARAAPAARCAATSRRRTSGLAA